MNNETTNGLAFKFVEGIGRVGIVAKQSKRCWFTISWLVSPTILEHLRTSLTMKMNPSTAVRPHGLRPRTPTLKFVQALSRSTFELVSKLSDFFHFCLVLVRSRSCQAQRSLMAWEFGESNWPAVFKWKSVWPGHPSLTQIPAGWDLQRRITKSFKLPPLQELEHLHRCRSTMAPSVQVLDKIDN